MKSRLIFLFVVLLFAACDKPSYKDNSLSPDRRADLLLEQLTLEEKVSLMLDVSKPVERLGVLPYNWWNEALHGVARSGLATVFPQPIGMAASFSPETVYEVFDAVSDEARAKNSDYVARGSYERYQGLTMWTPTVNIYRDPRWGRGIETYGEDPYLTSRMGVMVVEGLQGGNDGKYDKLHACAKHFAVHSGPEWNRHSFNAENIKPRDLWETYLPPFKALVQEAGVKEVMCAYNSFEGQPCCGSDQLLIQILRNNWGFDGIVLSDCGAISDFFNKYGHHTSPDAESASAVAVKAGTDLNCGSSYKALVESVKKGLISEEELNVSVKRLLKARFELGEMDDPKDVSWTKIPLSVVASAAHDSLALKAARESMVLLMNKNNALPLKRGGLTVAVMGPNADDAVMQWGNYNGQPPYTVTILDGIKASLGANDKLIYEQGCGLVERTLLKSVFDLCKTAEGKGFSAEYWNNVKREGKPVTTVQVANPFNFSTSGATVFAPGVNLTDFSATYTSVFTPIESGEVIFEIRAYGSGRLRVNGEEVKSFVNMHGSRGVAYSLNVKAGEKYDIELDFEYLRSDAQLSFDLGFKKNVDIRQSVARVAKADVVVFVGGISPSLEGEEMGVNLPGFKGGDRTDIELPAVQRELITALRKAGKKVVLVNCSGSPIGLEPETKTCDAILQAWYPGQAGGKAVAEVLFGDYNPSGKLPVTFYKNVSQLPDFEDYNMTGRTYRYMAQQPLFPFGYGLSYTTFEYGRIAMDKNEISVGEPLKLSVDVTNTGSTDGAEVVQVYLRKQGDTDGPLKTLRAFKRVNVPAGTTVKVDLRLDEKELEWWNETAQEMKITAGTYELMLGSSSQSSDLQTTTFAIK
ncbi:MAG: glycoside hydrolase family 3 C-terminal domain-containing protein [Culturomica sp.]|jgi:beta-glucosidase|nr:glycoside hydrolase family 3 C-terminal domain-containing protein [Culturomica sp.]